MSGKLIAVLSVLVFALGYTLATAVHTGQFAALLQSPGELVPEQLSPSARVGADAIHVYADKVVIDLEQPLWATFADTNSMDPLLDSGSFGIEVKPKSAEELNVGDVAAYRSENGEMVIHRIVEIGEDSEGLYFVFKGDNVPFVDPEQVRFEQIEAVLVAVIY